MMMMIDLMLTINAECFVARDDDDDARLKYSPAGYHDDVLLRDK